MVVDSVLDIYALALAFYVYNIFWDIFVGTGIIYIPIGIMFLNGIKESYESMRSDEDTGSSLKTTQIRMFGIVMAILLALAPTSRVDINGVKYIGRACAGEKVEGVISQKLMGRRSKAVAENMDMQLGGRVITAPPLLLFVLNVSNGIKNESVYQLPCTIDIRLYAESLLSQKISDPVLLLETTNFVQWCFQPAMAKWRRELRSTTGSDESFSHSNIENNWPGGRRYVFNIGANYYNNLDGDGFYAKSAVYGYPNRKEVIGGGEGLEDSVVMMMGYPPCNEWWLGPDGENTPYVNPYALSTRLFDNLDGWLRENEKKVWEIMFTKLASSRYQWKDEVQFIATKDAVVRQAYFTIAKLGDLDAQIASDTGLSGDTNVLDYAFRLAGTVGLVTSSVGQFSGASMLQLAMPMVKPFIIMIILIAYLPAMIVGLYKWKYISLFLMTLASVQLWPFFWELSRLIDDSLLDALDIPIEEVNTAIFSQWIAAGLHLYGPILFSVALGWAGVATPDNVMNKMAGQGGSAGQNGGKAVQKKAQQTAKNSAERISGGTKAGQAAKAAKGGKRGAP